MVVKTSEKMGISLNTPESYLDHKQKAIISGWKKEVVLLEDAIDDALGILHSIPEDPPEDWSSVNATIQDAYEALEAVECK